MKGDYVMLSISAVIAFFALLRADRAVEYGFGAVFLVGSFLGIWLSWRRDRRTPAPETE